MKRVDWNKIPTNVKEDILIDISHGIDAPCSYKDFTCPFKKHKLDCDKDNDSHCLVIDFIKSCVKVEH